MPKVSEEHATARQEQILEAATLCFTHSGFHATGMAEIIRESGLSAGSVYRYYKSKDDLIAAIVGRLVGGLQEQVIEFTRNATSPGEAIALCIQAASRLLQQGDTPYSRILPQAWTEALRNPEIAALVNAKYRPILQHFEDMARQMQQRGDLDGDLDPAGVAQVMLAAVQGFIVQKLILNHQVDDRVYAATAARLFTRS